MKLRYQILLLLALPLGCQLVTVGFIVNSFAQIDKEARKEAIAKEIVGLCQECFGLVGQAVSVSSAPRYVLSVENEKNLVLLVADRLANKVSKLKLLTRDNPSATLVVDRFERDSIRLFNGLRDLAGSYSVSHRKQFFSQFWDGVDYVESIKVLFDEIMKELDKLAAIYGQAAKEFEPAALKARQDLRNTIIVAIALNVLLVLTLAIVINRKTLGRLRTLMENMQHFARGEQKYVALHGADKLAELDHAFSQMASERDRLESIRKSMRAMVSHDLRSPLTSMGIYVEILLEETEPSLTNQARYRLRRLHAETQRLQRLANTLLDIEKMEDGKLEVHIESHTCAELFSRAIDVIQSQSDRKKITVVNQHNDSHCMCDKDRTIQVLINLLSNAIKFSPAGKQITVAAVPSTDRAMVRIEVLDEGPGIPESQAGALFNKFTQLEQPAEIQAEGSGLGLYICKMLITAQKGTIGYNKRHGGGSCFWVELLYAAMS